MPANSIPELEEVVRQLDEREMQAIQKTTDATKWNSYVNLTAVIFLGITMLAVVGGAIALSLNGSGIPQAIVALGAAAVGALAGLLSFPKR